MVAAYEFMYVTPGIQNLIRENKVFRIDSEIQTGKRYGMQLLDETLFALYQAGKISSEETIDKSRIPGQMMDRFTRHGIDPGKNLEDFPPEEESGGAKSKPGASPAGSAAGGGQSEAERQAQMAANRARLSGGKK